MRFLTVFLMINGCFDAGGDQDKIILAYGADLGNYG